MSSPAGPIRDLLEDQLATSWKLLDLHLADLEDDECLWRPAPRGPHVVEDAGTWRAAWPESEDYETGPASIAWLTWHIGFWWSMALDHSFGDGTLQRDDVTWPGTTDATRNWLTDLHDAWVAELSALPDRELVSTERTRWPFTDRPFHRVPAWVNLELMKNASEIGYCRFLYAARIQRSGE